MMKYIHRAVSLVNFYFSVMYHAFFFLMGVVCLCEHIFFFIFLKGFVHREMKERKACNEVAQPTQHCAVVSTPSHTLLFAYCPAAMYWRLWLSFTATVNWIVREAARLRCYRLFVLNFCFAFQFSRHEYEFLVSPSASQFFFPLQPWMCSFILLHSLGCCAKESCPFQSFASQLSYKNVGAQVVCITRNCTKAVCGDPLDIRFV